MYYETQNHLLKKIQNTRNTVHRTMTPQVPFKVRTFLRKSGSLVAVWITSSATMARRSFCSGSRSCRTNFATTLFMPRSCVKISGTVLFGIPRSASSSRTVSHRSLLIAAHTCSTFSGVLLVAGLPECGSLSRDSQPPLKCLCHTFICTALLQYPRKPSESSE